MKKQFKSLGPSLSLFLSLSLLSACSPQAFHVHNGSEVPSIVGGQVVENEIFAKHVVALYNQKSSVLCTATLITKNVLLTAAHCANIDKATDYFVFFTKSPRYDRDVIFRRVIDIRIFDYNPEAVRNRRDLALVRFQGELPAGYEPMPLPTAQDLKGMGKIFYAAGYGTVTAREDLGDRQSGTLRYTQLQIMEGRISPQLSQFTVDQADGRGICHGDSGGPAFIKLNGRRILIGVASAVYALDKNAKKNPGFDMCRQNSIYISTFYYLDWIRKTSAALAR